MNNINIYIYYTEKICGGLFKRQRVICAKHDEVQVRRRLLRISDLNPGARRVERTPVTLKCWLLLPLRREEHPDLVESMAKKGSNVPEKPKTPQQLWYNHEKKAFLKSHPDVGRNNSGTPVPQPN